MISVVSCKVLQHEIDGCALVIRTQLKHLGDCATLVALYGPANFHEVAERDLIRSVEWASQCAGRAWRIANDLTECAS